MLKRVVPLFIVLMALTGAPRPALAAFGDAKPGAANGADVDIADPLTARARLQPSSVEAGGTSELLVEMTLAPHFHAYLERFKLAIESPDDLKLGSFKISPVVKFYDGATKSEKEGIENSSTLKALIEVPSGFRAGSFTARLKLTYQACTEDHCLFPKSVSVDVPLTVTGGAMMSSAGGPAVALPAAKPASEFETALGKGTFSGFLLVFVVGFLTSLTPCIYPMIPITLAVLGARAKNQSHAKNFSIALVYVLGIALTYSALGVIAASTGGLFGSALSNVYVVSGIALVFLAMGLSMFGAYEIQAPAFIRNRLGAARTTSGYGGALVTGLLAGVVASPCIGPVLVSLLAWIAQTRSLTLGFFLLFTFAFGMGLPFIALGLSSSWISRLPKAGPWMDTVKYLFGILMVGMAFFYIKPLYPVWLFNALLGLALVVFASAVGAYAAIAPEAGVAPRIRKGLLQAVLGVGVGLTVFGVLARVGVTNDLGVAAPLRSEARSPLDWKPFSNETLETALKGGKPVLIDFTAEWCGACKEMESTVFVDPKIVETSRNFTLLKVDGTEDTPALRQIVERFGVQGFPTYLFFDSKGQLRRDLTVFGAYPTDSFQQKMSAAL